MSIPSFQGVFPCDGFIIAYPAGGFHRLGLHFGAVAYVFERLGAACKRGPSAFFVLAMQAGPHPHFAYPKPVPPVRKSIFVFMALDVGFAALMAATKGSPWMGPSFAWTDQDPRGPWTRCSTRRELPEPAV